MIKRSMTGLLAALILFSLSSCAKQETTRYTTTFLQLFDTMTEIVAYTDNKEEFERFSNLVHDNLKEYHELYDIYNDVPGVNNLKTINDNAGIAPVKVDRRIIELLQFAKKEEKASSGTFNIALGAVLRIWHAHREEGSNNPERASLPSMEELQEAMEHTNIDDVLIDEAASTVYLADPAMSLDVGSIAKGYATEQVALLAEKAGFDSALLSVGGNVRAIGSRDGKGEPWKVGLRNPDSDSEQKDLFITLLTDASLVTSGVYERYYTVDGKKYHHIIDPATLMPSERYLSVSVIVTDSGRADALTTALFNMSLEDGLTYIATQTDAEACWVLPDGELRYSEGFEQYIKK